MNSRYPSSRTPSSRPYGSVVILFRDAVNYVSACVNVVSRTVSLDRQLINYAGAIVSEVSNVLILNRQLTNYVGSIVNLINTTSFLRMRLLLGRVTKTSGLTGIMRRRRH